MIRIASPARLCRWSIVAATFALAGCIAPHACVSNMTKEVPTSEFKKPDPLHPVQVIIEFQTKGIANARATDAFKQAVVDQVAASGLFDKVSDQPAANGALLAIKVNNIPLTDDAAAKGVATYVSGAGATPILISAKHAIHTVIGNADAPADSTPASSLQVGATMMLHQVVSQLLNDMSRKPDFK